MNADSQPGLAVPDRQGPTNISPTACLKHKAETVINNCFPLKGQKARDRRGQYGGRPHHPDMGRRALAGYFLCAR